MAPPEISVTKSRTDCALTQQMVGGVKASSTGVKSMSADMFLDLPTMSAPSGEQRRTDASAQVERAGWCCRRPDSGMCTCCSRAAVMAFIILRPAPEEGRSSRQCVRPSCLGSLPPRQPSILSYPNLRRAQSPPGCSTSLAQTAALSTIAPGSSRPAPPREAVLVGGEWEAKAQGQSTGDNQGAQGSSC